MNNYNTPQTDLNVEDAGNIALWADTGKHGYNAASCDVVHVDVSRKIERELNAAIADRDAFVKELDGDGNVVSAMVNLNRLKTAHGVYDNVQKWSNMSDSELRLYCGELTAQEIRTIRAVLKAVNSI